MSLLDKLRKVYEEVTLLYVEYMFVKKNGSDTSELKMIVAKIKVASHRIERLAVDLLCSDDSEERKHWVNVI